MSDLETAVDEAVDAAKTAYADEPNNPFDHGFAHMEIDGRTRLANAMQDHSQVDAGDSSYVTIDGVSRYLSPQQAAYRAFVETLDDHGIDTDCISRHGRLD
jgi:hypothetical protein